MTDIGQYQEPMRPGGRGSRQKIMKLREELQTSKQRKSDQEQQAERIRQLKESYDLALLKADEMVRGPGNNIYARAHGERAKRVYTALSSVIYSTIAIAKVKPLEEYIRQNALTLPASMIDLAEWEYVLRTAADCRSASTAITNEASDSNSGTYQNNSQVIIRENRKKFEVLHYLATTPTQTTRDEIETLKQSVFETLNEFSESMTQTMNAIVYYVEQMRENHRKDASINRIHTLTEENRQLQNALLQEKESAQGALIHQQSAYEQRIENMQNDFQVQLQQTEENFQFYKNTSNATEITLKTTIDDLQRALTLSKDETAIKGNHIVDLNSQITNLQAELVTERSFSKNLSEHEVANIVHIMASSTTDQVVKSAVSLRTYFEGFKDVSKLVQDSLELAELRIKAKEVDELLQAQELKMKQLEQQVDSQSQVISSTQADLQAQRTLNDKMSEEFASNEARLQQEIELLNFSLAQEKNMRSEENVQAEQKQAELQRQVSDRDIELEKLNEAFAQLKLAFGELQQQHETLGKEKQLLLIESLQKENEKINGMQGEMKRLSNEHQELKGLLNKTEEEKSQHFQTALALEHEKIHGLEQTIELLTQEMCSLQSEVSAVKTLEESRIVPTAVETLVISKVPANILEILSQAEAQIKELVDILQGETTNNEMLVEALITMEQELIDTQTALQQSQQTILILSSGLNDEEELLSKYEQLQGEVQKLNTGNTSSPSSATAVAVITTPTASSDREELLSEITSLKQVVSTLREENSQLLATTQSAQSQQEQEASKQAIEAAKPIEPKIRRKSVGFSDLPAEVIPIVTTSSAVPAIIVPPPEQQEQEQLSKPQDKEKVVDMTGFMSPPPPMMLSPSGSIHASLQDYGEIVVQDIAPPESLPEVTTVVDPVVSDSPEDVKSSSQAVQEASMQEEVSQSQQEPETEIPISFTTIANEKPHLLDAPESLSTIDSEASLIKIQAAIRRKLATNKVQRVKLEKTGLMSACIGTVQGETGWYVSQQQYFYFVRDAMKDFILLCGPLSQAMYNLAMEEIRMQMELDERNTSIKIISAGNDEIQGVASERSIVNIDRLALHATRMQMETFLQDIQERENYIQALQNQLEMMIKQQARSNLLLEEQQKMIDMKLANVPPDQLELAMKRMTSAARGYLARSRVKKLKLFRTADETGVLVAIGNTQQGETGWYAGPNGNIFYFVLQEVSF